MAQVRPRCGSRAPRPRDHGGFPPRLRTSVEIPEDFRVTEIGVDEVLGVWTDEMDVQHPQVRRLRRGGE